MVRSDSPNGYTFEGEAAHIDLLFRKAAAGQRDGIVLQLVIGAVVIGFLAWLQWVAATVLL